MKLKFILGRAGSGKTHYCLEAIRTELKRSPTGDRLILLAPEQATFQMDRALLADEEICGYARAQVLSFRRLAYLVFEELGGPALPPAGNLVRRMLLGKILAANRERLRVFGPSSRRPGLAGEIADAISELHRYRHPPEDLESQLAALEEAGEGDSLLALKLADLMLVYREYHAALAGSYTDADDYLDILAEKLPRSELTAGARVWVDGFAGFTPQEYGVLEQIIKQARVVEVALCLDPADAPRLPRSPSDLDPASLFHPTEETYVTLRALAARLHVEVEEVRLGAGTGRFGPGSDLAHIEAELFKDLPKPYPRRPAGVRLVEAGSRRAEINAVAREILRLCKDENLRFRDMAVIVRDLDTYHEVIQAAFSEFEIPYFIDRRREVTYHPLVELIRAAVRVAVTDWATEPVLRYLKSDLAPVERDAADVIENYVTAHGIAGSAWYQEEPWRYRKAADQGADDELPAAEEAVLPDINTWRLAGVEALKKFCDRVRARSEPTVRDVTAALFELLSEVGARDRIESWRDEAEKERNFDLASRWWTSSVPRNWRSRNTSRYSTRGCRT